MTRILARIGVALLLMCAVVSEESFGQTINTVAGTGTAGFSGDGGAATSAQLNFPQAVFVDGSGNI